MIIFGQHLKQIENMWEFPIISVKAVHSDAGAGSYDRGMEKKTTEKSLRIFVFGCPLLLCPRKQK